MAGFIQQAPQLAENRYHADGLLRRYLQRALPQEVLSEIEPDLERFGRRVSTDIAEMAADAIANEPSLVQFDAWGNRIDRLVVADGWKQLDRVSAEEGLVSIAYERKYGEYSRIYQMAKFYLFHPSSALYSCPLAMTDGAARVMELLASESLRARALPRLTSRDPQTFWTSGQWMTERRGGSDVAQSETIARRDGDGYRLYGDKWFTSAVSAQMALTLARVVDDNGATVEGSRGLSMFYLEIAAEDGGYNGLTIHRLKDKLGTRALPTAELTLDGTRAQLVGDVGRGVKNITHLLNITRMGNAICSVAMWQHGLALARDYAMRRQAFGRTLASQPLHLETLAELAVELEGCFSLVGEAAALMGRVECNVASDEQTRLMRLLTPICKLYLGKRGVAALSEIVEGFGGAGYLEDTGIPALLRDGQVMSIWEGTTNVLSLDVLRAMDREQALPVLIAEVHRRLKPVTAAPLCGSRDQLSALTRQLVEDFLPRALAAGPDALIAGARQLAFCIAQLFGGVLLVEQAQQAVSAEAASDEVRRAIAVAARWCAKLPDRLMVLEEQHRDESRLLAGCTVSN
ncbi:MAG: acyl-CoA dehydrogenase family protein [Deltaproteobacteria bacterium]|nr:acyl-CoA dehydrogenase family protein [Deltaproteobacteria bacterium]